MTNSEPPNSSISEPLVEPEVKQEPLSGRENTWLRKLRFLVAVVIIFIGLIEYKVIFPNQNVAVDILALGIIGSLVATVAGIPVHRAIAGFVRAVLEVPWANKVHKGFVC